MNPIDPTPPLEAEELLVHARFLRGLTRQLVVDASSADDLSQETWLATLGNPPEHTGNLRGWLVRVARRLAGAQRRSEGRRREREQDSDQELTLPGPSETAARREALQRVTRAVLALEEPYATTVQLRYYEGLEASEIALQTGVPLATVRSRLQRALQQLRGALDAEYGGDRQAWCLGLVSLLASKNLTEASAKGGGKLGLGAGVPMMGTGVKIAVAALGLGLAGFVCLAGFVWWNARGEQVSVDAGGRVEGGTRELAVPAHDEREAGLLASPVDLASSREAQPASQASKRGALEVQVSWARDGSPAADLELSILLWAHAAGDRKRGGRTDADGKLRFEDLLAGPVRVETSFGSGGQFEVEASETTRGALEIAEGFSVRGRVVDREGVGVAGAQLWLSEYGDSSSGFLVAEAGADGVYELNEVPRGRYLGAVADGFAPSSLRRLDAGRSLRHAAADIEVELVLGDDAGGLQIQVVSAVGEPVAGAFVWLRGAVRHSPASNRTVGQEDRGAALHDWCDRLGWIEMRGLQVGLARLNVYAPGMAPWSGPVKVVASTLETLRVELQPECVVFGLLRGPANEPAEGTQVALVQDYDPLMAITVADDAGRYELRGLPAGEVQLKAIHKELGSITATLQLDPETPTRWDSTLGEGRVIVGRVIDEGGQPLEGWNITAAPVHGGRWRAQTESDEGGRFRLLNCKPEALVLTLHRTFLVDHMPNIVREVSSEHVGEVLLVVGPSELCDSSVRGQLLSVEGEPLPMANCSFRPLDLNLSYGRGYLTDTQGRFLAEGMHAGPYGLTIKPEYGSGWRLSNVSLAAHENHDLGTIRLPRPGLLRLSVSGAQATGRQPYMAFHIDQVDPSGAILLPGVAHIPAAELADPIELYPGHYRVKAIADGPFAHERLSLTIEESAADARLEFHPRAGRSCTLGTSIPEGERLPAQATISLYDEAGTLLRSVTDRGPVQRRFSLWEQLAVGFYSFEVEVPDGRRLQHSFEVPPPDPDGGPLERLVFVLPLSASAR